jgi:uncharacterized membrane protein YeaQ/YmgE (transglycosylase-associated protein family)
MTFLSIIEFVPFGLLVGALAHRLALRRRGHALGWMLVGAAGALAGGLGARVFASWPGEGPQGFAFSLLGALVFVVVLACAMPRPSTSPNRLSASRSPTS